MKNTKDSFQSVIRFSLGKVDHAVGLALFASLGNGELDTRIRLLLHPEEIETGNGFASDVRRRSFLHGRTAAKTAIGQVFPAIPPTGVLIATDCLGKPFPTNLTCPYAISIAHDDLWNAGLCFPLQVPMGVDVESIVEKNREIIAFILTPNEMELCRREADSLEFMHLLWTAKEAAGKALGVGFRVPAEWYEIETVETLQTEPGLIRQCQFKKLTAYTALSVKIPGGMLAVSYPSEKNLDQTMVGLLKQL